MTQDIGARTRLIDATARLMQIQGYHNTGLSQILAESRAPRGSLYHYFPGGKVDLAIAAIEYASDRTAVLLTELCAAHEDPVVGIAAVLDHFAGELEDSGYSKGCPVATITLEQAAVNEPVRQACTAAYDRWQQGLAAWLTLRGVAAAEAVAEQLLVCIEGALILARARRSTAPLRQLEAGLPALLNYPGVQAA